MSKVTAERTLTLLSSHVSLRLRGLPDRHRQYVLGASSSIELLSLVSSLMSAYPVYKSERSIGLSTGLQESLYSR